MPSGVWSAARVDVNVGFDASLDAVRRAVWPQQGIAHFATHAILNSHRPDFSGVVLSMHGADGTPRNGVLRLTDLSPAHASVARRPEWLPDLGGRAGRAGQGLVGISRAFLMAGAGACWVRFGKWTTAGRAG